MPTAKLLQSSQATIEPSYSRAKLQPSQATVPGTLGGRWPKDGGLRWPKGQGGDDKVAVGSGGARSARGGRVCDAGSIDQPLLSVLGSSMYGGGGDIELAKDSAGEAPFTNAASKGEQTSRRM